MTKLTSITRGALVAGAVVLGACTETTVPDYNNPGESVYTNLSTAAQLESQAVGIIDSDRRSHDFQILLDETIARNVYRIDGSESRYITQNLRGNLATNSNFVGGSVFVGPYRTIRSAQLLIDAVGRYEDDELPVSQGGARIEFGDAEKAATVGLAQTFKALSYMRLIEQRDTIGIPLFSGLDDVNPILCKPSVLASISAILDSGYTSLTAAGGADFPFALPSGFAGFDTPESFARVNRALKAKNEVYRAFAAYAATTTPSRAAIDAAALTRAQEALDASFYDPAGDLVNAEGVFHTYSTAAGDYTNPNADIGVIRINPRVVREAEGATFTLVGPDTAWSSPDQRLARKVDLYVDTDGTTDCLEASDVRSCFQDKVNSSLTHPLPIIRNDELHLLQAQIHWGRAQYPQAMAIVNDVRNRAGGLATPLVITEELPVLRAILQQKRYQLLFESAARFVDFRMYGLLAELGLERPSAGEDEEWGTEDDIEGYLATSTPVFPIPLAENLARGGDLSKTCN